MTHEKDKSIKIYKDQRWKKNNGRHRKRINMCKILNKCIYMYIVLHSQSTKIVKLVAKRDHKNNIKEKIIKEEVRIRYNSILRSNLLHRRIPLYQNITTPESFHDLLSPNRVNERNTRVYRPVSFNPSHLVFSCCSACFFFVQRFSIY